MSLQRSRGKKDLEHVVFASAHTNARVASAWGPARSAVAAVHNLASLLRRSHVAGPVIFDLLPELRGGAGVLRQAFERARGSEDRAASGVGEYGSGLVGELDALLDAVHSLSDRRQDFARHAGALADSLEASVDLLALLDRAAAPLVTDVRLDLLAKEAGRMSGTARGRELAVGFDSSSPHCILSTDPTVLGAMVSLLVASIHDAAGNVPLVLRARSSPKAQFVVETCDASDNGLPLLAIRVMSWIAPSGAVARRVASNLGATLEVGGLRASLTLPIPGD